MTDRQTEKVDTKRDKEDLAKKIRQNNITDIERERERER